MKIGLERRGTVILGVAESDAHVVANHLIEHLLRKVGYEVVNLGPCTSVDEFMQAARMHPEAEAILIGSLNGHAASDLATLAVAKRAARVTCPVILGGNLSVGSNKVCDDSARLMACGVDIVLESYSQILPTLERLARERRLQRSWPPLERWVEQVFANRK
jgi:methylaspartate mutase sigma subunit